MAEGEDVFNESDLSVESVDEGSKEGDALGKGHMHNVQNVSITYVVRSTAGGN